MAHIITLGNEKGGSGKSTTAMHVMCAILRSGHTVGAIDLDLRQRSFFRYLENRADFIRRKNIDLPVPRQMSLSLSKEDSQRSARAQEEDAFASAIDDLAKDCTFILIDCPGAFTRYSQMAHAAADTLITPMNDSLVDLDLLAHLDPTNGQVIGPSVYSEMVWRARQARAKRGEEPVDWVVLRNRMTSLNAKNKRRVGSALDDLAKRIGFRVIPGFSERVVFRELFLSGLTLLDLKDTGAGSLNISNIAARQEVRDLVKALKLPGVTVGF